MSSKPGPVVRAVLAFCLLLLAAGPAAAQTGTITGIVTDAETGRAVAGAQVQALAATGRVGGSALTNSAGRYQLNVPAGEYEVSVESVGYEATRSNRVTVASGGIVTMNITARQVAFQLNPVVVTASRRQEKATDAPARVEVITERDIRERPAVTPVDHLRGTPGVDVITQGVQSTNVVARGFNNIFSGALHTLTDNRMAGVPSLRVNVLHFVPTTSEDLQRMEVVLGPGAALYGPNTASGVLHMITKSPLTEPGTVVSFMGGERNIFQGNFRTAQRLSDRIGVKISASMLTGQEWEYIDPDEVAERQKFDADPFFRADMMRALGIEGPEADRRINLIGNRDNNIRRFSGEARFDALVTPELTTVLQAGVTNVGTGVELTGLGAAQIENWRYMYYQARANWNRLFAQVYLNQSNAGDTYLLRTGQPIIDESTLVVGQLQHAWALNPRQGFTYGLDYFFTNPQTRGTITGMYEDEDQTTEVGAYLQSETALSPRFDLVLAGRVDNHSALPDPIFSPRAALVIKPAEEQSVRLTFNRAFSTPSSLNQFLDLPTAMPDQATDPLRAAAARLGYSVRVQGTGTTGFNFRQPDGSYQMRSPFTPAGLGGPAQLLPSGAAHMFFPATVQVALAQGAGAHPLMTQPRINALLSAQPTAAQIGTNFLHEGQSFPIAGLDLAPIAPIRETTTTSYEVGYKGILADRFSLAADVWTSRIQNFVTPLTISTPLLLLNGQQTGAYIVERLLTTGTATMAEAVALAEFLAPRLATVPVGVVSTTEINASGAQLLATYTNVNETLSLWGADVGVQALMTPTVSLTVSGSIVSDDSFDTSVGLVTLNAPKHKGALGLAYRDLNGRMNGEVRARYNASHPVKSGVYEATRCIDGLATSNACVEAYTLVDLTLGVSVPQLRGAALQLSVQNLFDEGYRSFPGVPDVGRLALVRLRYEF
jgi:outer membrane receptor for ferrienterochelin and colicins